MVPLGLTSVAMWALIVDRTLCNHQLQYRDLETAAAVRALRGEGVPATGPGLCREFLREFLARRSGDPALDRRILHQVNLRRRPALRRHLSMIAALASVAPILGLLGTVLGMVETFNVISVFGTGNANALAGGISVALVTTQTGLVVAIPGLLFAGTLFRRARRLETRLDEFTQLLDRTLKNAGSPPAEGALL
jgi:biopolymer transport protein ExbB